MNSEIERLEKEVGALQKKLTEARRAAPAEPVEDYQLRRIDGSPVRLSELFEGRDDLLVVHNMGRKSVYCTLWADGFESMRPHLEDRCAFVLSSADEPEVATEFAASRGWSYQVVSAAGSGFAKDMGFASETGDPWPGVSAFRRLEDGSIVRTGRATFGPGDPFCPAWHFFDLLEGGAGEWAPKFSYA
jgi:predicted dithiol-disulfide oxidoreductase (DUF899 family)